MQHFFEFAAAIIVGFLIGIFILKCIFEARALKKVDELKDCPFKYSLTTADDEYIIFQLDANTSLWCEYGFGLRSDGVYGVNEIKIRGINGKRAGHIELAIGQSVFPLINKMDQFEAWAKLKAFDFKWDTNFQEVWEDMKKKLDNLRFLETKSIEKENKKKK